MYSHEEFKDILNQKKIDYVRTRRYRRGKFLSAGISLILCVALTVAFLNRPLSVRADNLMDGVTVNPVSGTVTDDRFIENQMRFSVQLLKACQNGENLLLSPLSISLALTMAANGAGGQTRVEMEQLLAGDMTLEELNGYLKYYVNHLTNTADAKLTVANSIWFRNDDRLWVKPTFLQINADYFGADAYASAFDESTVRDINNWVSYNTDGLIDRVVEKIDGETMLYLINALLFDAQWESVYETNQVRKGTFTASDGTVRRVEMMHSTGFGYLQDDQARGFVKDYAQGYRFAALLPNEDVTLEEYIEKLHWESLLEMLEAPQGISTQSGLPKFEYSCDLKLAEVLTGLGMGTAFDDWGADFSGMGRYQDGNLYLGNVLHKTHIQVAEKGTRAGAVTTIPIHDATSAPEVQQILLDRPFLYLIIDTTTNLPILVGTVNDIP